MQQKPIGLLVFMSTDKPLSYFYLFVSTKHIHAYIHASIDIFTKFKAKPTTEMLPLQRLERVLLLHSC